MMCSIIILTNNNFNTPIIKLDVLYLYVTTQVKLWIYDKQYKWIFNHNIYNSQCIIIIYKYNFY